MTESGRYLTTRKSAVTTKSESVINLSVPDRSVDSSENHAGLDSVLFAPVD